MKLLSTIDALLRDRDSLYPTADEPNLGKRCFRMLLIFILTSALYGAAMGSFRWFHPEYYFSDFELTAPDGKTSTGKVAGMNSAKKTVYTRATGLPKLEGATIRFNLTRPSDPYPIASIGEEKGYGAITLAPEAVLQEPTSWQLPLLAAVKIPALFVFTLLVCSLALYLLNLTFGMNLHFMPTMSLMTFALAVKGIMLGVFIPIVLLFSIVTESYHFLKVLHVVVFTIAGLTGAKVLFGGLKMLAPKDLPWTKVRSLLVTWLLLYALVGAQLAWTLKPFLGTPYLPATPPFRLESGNIYVSFFQSLSQVGK